MRAEEEQKRSVCVYIYRYRKEAAGGAEGMMELYWCMQKELE